MYTCIIATLVPGRQTGIPTANPLIPFDRSLGFGSYSYSWDVFSFTTSWLMVTRCG